MNVLIIFAHPNEESFCAAIREQIIAGLKIKNHKLRVHNLYQENFNPILSKEELLDKRELENDIQAVKYQEDIRWAKRIIIIHPAYWYTTPAILKGYFDRLLSEGFAYDYVIDHPEPKLLGKKGWLIQTFDAEEDLEIRLFENVTCKTVLYTWKYCGVEEWQYFSMFQVNFTSNEQRKEWLNQAYKLGLNLE